MQQDQQKNRVFHGEHQERIPAEKESIPLKFFVRIGINVFFTTLLLWALLGRFVYLVFLQYYDVFLLLYITFGISLMLSLALVPLTIKKELANINEPFTITVRDPKNPIVNDKLTLRKFVARVILSFALTAVFTLPLTIFSMIKLFVEGLKWSDLYPLWLHGFTGLIVAVFLGSVFVSFVIIPSLKNWQWIKHQF